MINIKVIEKKDLHMIQSLAYAIWPLAFKNILSTEQITYMLALMYDLNALETQLEGGYEFITVSEHDQPLGFACFQPISEKGFCKVHRLYILPTAQDKGFGRKLVEYITQVSLSKHLYTLRLNVNKLNPAINFYYRMGFKILGDEKIDIGKGFVMDDFVMHKHIDLAKAYSAN